MKTRPLIWKGRHAALWRFPLWLIAYCSLLLVPEYQFVHVWAAFMVGWLLGGFSITKVEYAPRKWVWTKQAPTSSNAAEGSEE